jgi:parallel beta-helix repeat protein
MRRKLHSSIIFNVFWLLFVFIVPELSHAVTVSKTGGDYNRIQDALDNAVPGDTIYVKEGTYKEKLEFYRGGSKGMGNIVLKNFENDKVVLDGRGIRDTNMIYINNQSYIVIQGFEIINNLNVRTGAAIMIEGHGSNIEIRNNKIHEIRGRLAMGITVYGTSSTPIENLIIDGNEIFNCEPTKAGAIHINGNVRDFKVTNNSVHDVNNAGIEIIGGQTWIKGYFPQGGLCKNNVVYRARSKYRSDNFAGIHVDGAKDITIEGNRIYDNDIGIDISAWKKGVDTTGIIVRQNIVYANDNDGMSFGGYERRGGRVINSEFYNNVLYKNQVELGGGGELTGRFAFNNVIANNIIFAGRQGIIYASWNGDDGNTFDNNCYYRQANSEEEPFYVNNTGFEDFREYRSSTSRDKNSIFKDPMFNNESSHDFTLKMNSPCIDAGVDLGIAYSNAAPDIGVFEQGLNIITEKIPEKDLPAIKQAAKNGTHLEIEHITFGNVFPVFFKYYDEHPVGNAILRNKTTFPAKDIEITLFVKQYMDIPKKCQAPKTLKAGEQKEIGLNVLFTNNVLEITEGTKVAVLITLEYSLKGAIYKEEYTETMRIHNRNAMTWDDDRKAAAFVTAKDPAVLRFAKNVVGVVGRKESRAVNKNLLTAIAMHEAVSLYGMSYVIDPTTPFKEFSVSKKAVDFLQFPRQTLEYRAGDCDDLSILYSALLESVGIETSFITIPGHILMAFSLDLEPDKARKTLISSDELIFMGKNVWIPVEVTALDNGFLKAWEIGAKEWREAVSKDKEGFFPMLDSWTVYEPVGLPGDAAPISPPSKDQLTVSYLEEVTKFIDKIILPMVAKLQSEINKSEGDPKFVNKLGVLYARNGLTDKAQKEFKRLLSKNESYVPALLNLGNIYYLEDDMEKALLYYEKAYSPEPGNPKVILCMARVNHELENYGIVNKFYNKLKETDPDLAARYLYLGLKGEESTRAADISGVKDTVLWDEE